MKTFFCTVMAVMTIGLLSACGHSEKGVSDTGDVRYQAINVMTPGVAGAHCFLQAGSASYNVAAGSKVMVRRTAAPLDISCFKGEHMVGRAIARPTVAPREAQAMRTCESCLYPETVSVVMALRGSSVERSQVRHWN